MNMIDDILWLITARSGSKSIKDKNIKLLNQIPLIHYRIKTALALSEKDNIWVSTDSKDYAKIANDGGAVIPFIRPEELSTDNANSMDVVLHAMRHASNKNLFYRFIGLLEPTSPFIYKQDLINAVSRLREDENAEAIVAVKENRPNTFYIQDNAPYLEVLADRFGNHAKLGRQEFSMQVTPSGGFYIAKWNSFLKHKTFYTKNTIPYLIPDECSLEIDEPLDWKWAEFLINEKIIDVNKVF